MNILWFTWKDQDNPQAGGAELVNEELAKRMVLSGHKIKFVVAGYVACESVCNRNGFEIIRIGGRWSVYWKAYRYYKKNLQNWADVVIDEVNTVPFFAKFYIKKPCILFIHQLCRQIWFHQMFFPLNLIGYLIEPLYLRLLNNQKVITVSDSTKQDLQKHGFVAENISVITPGITLEPVADLQAVKKYDNPTILSLGAIRSMKRTHHIIKAFEIAKKENPNLRLIIAGGGSGRYYDKVLTQVAMSPFVNDIVVKGKVDDDEKIKLMQNSHVIAVTSVKEGWGLIVPEANSQGTPAVVYNIDGLRDSVRDGQTGWITKSNTPQYLAISILQVFKNNKCYQNVRKQAWEWSNGLNFDQSVERIDVLLKNYVINKIRLQKPMSLVIAPLFLPGSGGKELSTHRLSQKIKEKGITDVEIVCFQRPGQQGVEEFDKEYNLPVFRIKNPLIASGFKILKHSKKSKPLRMFGGTKKFDVKEKIAMLINSIIDSLLLAQTTFARIRKNRDKVILLHCHSFSAVLISCLAKYICFRNRPIAVIFIWQI